MDRIVQQAILQVIDPTIDPKFSDNSYSFRKRRNAHQVIDKAIKHYQHDYKVIVDCDFKNYFDIIYHERMRAYLEHFISESKQ